jgi:hypothetical protein
MRAEKQMIDSLIWEFSSIQYYMKYWWFNGVHVHFFSKKSQVSVFFSLFSWQENICDSQPAQFLINEISLGTFYWKLKHNVQRREGWKEEGVTTWMATENPVFTTAFFFFFFNPAAVSSSLIPWAPTLFLHPKDILHQSWTKDRRTEVHLATN